MQQLKMKFLLGYNMRWDKNMAAGVYWGEFSLLREMSKYLTVRGDSPHSLSRENPALFLSRLELGNVKH